MTHYVYRVKRLLRNKTLFFWTILFPLGLATLFKFAFSAITENRWGFATIPVAVTTENGTAVEEIFVEFLTEMENDEAAFFSVTETDKVNAERLLSEKEVTAVIVFGEETEVLFYENGLNATVVKTVVDSYLQSRDIFMEAAMTGKLAEVTESFADETETLVVREFEGASKDPMVQYFQALIAMTSLYGAMYGLLNAGEMNQNQTVVAARRLAAPMRKLPTVLADVAAACTIQYLQFLLMLAYYLLVLKIDFGTVNGWLFIAGALYSLFGVLIGYFFGCVLQKEKGIADSIMTGCIMFSCFLGGLMLGNMRMILETYVPIVNRINPATLIAESMHALCVIRDIGWFARCMLSIVVWCILLIIVSVVALGYHQRKNGREVKKA